MSRTSGQRPLLVTKLVSRIRFTMWWSFVNCPCVVTWREGLARMLHDTFANTFHSMEVNILSLWFPYVESVSSGTRLQATCHLVRIQILLWELGARQGHGFEFVAGNVWENKPTNWNKVENICILQRHDAFLGNSFYFWVLLPGIIFKASP